MAFDASGIQYLRLSWIFIMHTMTFWHCEAVVLCTRHRNSLHCSQSVCHLSVPEDPDVSRIYFQCRHLQFASTFVNPLAERLLNYQNPTQFVSFKSESFAQLDVLARGKQHLCELGVVITRIHARIHLLPPKLFWLFRWCWTDVWMY